MEEKDVLNEIVEAECVTIKASMKNLYSVWDDIGLDKNLKVVRLETAWSHIQNLIQDICNEELAVYEDLQKRIMENTEKVSDLAKVLSMDTLTVTGLSLLKRDEVLYEEFNKLTAIKDKRMKDFDDLKKVEKQFCLILGLEEQRCLSKSKVPSAEEIKELEQQVKFLTEEHGKRYEKYCEARKEFIFIIENTELVPDSSLEKHLLTAKEPLSLSADTLKAVQKTVDKAKEKMAELEKQKNFLMEKLNTLWEQLKTDNDLKVSFLSNHLDCKPTTIKSLQKELARCEELKRQNIGPFVETLRKQINDLWVKCGVSEAERQLFHLYESTEANEEILIAHEQELERLKSYYEEVKPILEKIEKRNQQWEKLGALDQSARDPARYKNRGGFLLKEERERNKLQKSLPALEEDICKRIDIYEADTSRKFLFFGADYRSIICAQWEQRQGHKENVKQDNKVSQFSTPAKRPQFATPKSAPCPRLNRYGTPLVKPAPKSVKKFPLSRPNVIKKRDQDILKELNKKGGNQASNETAYSDFANELNRSERRSFRSSVVAAKKVGGTRISMNSLKKKKKNPVRITNTPDKDSVGLDLIRGKLGLPFLM